MKVICAPDSFKESLSAPEVAEAMARGVRDAAPEAAIDRCPVADGGEGFADVIGAATDGSESVALTVDGPRREPVNATFVILPPGADRPRTAVIEMAGAAGLALVPHGYRNPLGTTTHGVGQLVAEAARRDCRRIILGIGGSATNDGGCGLAQALGVRFLDPLGRVFEQPITGGMLRSITHIDTSGLPDDIRRLDIEVACDVTNPLTGPHGAAHVYGPQKGATRPIADMLDASLRHLAALWREQLRVDVERLPGAGAAGGLGGGLVAFLGATLRPGIDLVLEVVGFEQRVAGCDLCLTGEGRLDGQSVEGKACIGVAQAAARRGVPTIAIVGCTGPGVEMTLEAGLRSYHAIGEGLSPIESMNRAAELVRKTTGRVLSSRAGH